METEPSQSCIAYYRVSTQKQGRSGLGLEAYQINLRRSPIAVIINRFADDLQPF
jgi:hypothetical protein